MVSCALQARNSGGEAHHVLLRAIWRLHWRGYMAIGFIKLLGDALNFAGPFLLQLLLRCASVRLGSTHYG